MTELEHNYWQQKNAQSKVQTSRKPNDAEYAVQIDDPKIQAEILNPKTTLENLIRQQASTNTAK